MVKQLFLILFVCSSTSLSLLAASIFDGQIHEVDDATTYPDDLLLFAGTELRLLENGVIGGSLYLYQNCVARIRGGTVVDAITAYSQSRVILSDGSVEQIAGWDDALITVSGAELELGITARDQSIIHVFGGRIFAGGFQGMISANDPSSIFLYGSDFAVNGTNVPYGVISEMTGKLTGTLAGGTPIPSTDYENFQHAGYDGSIELCPPLLIQSVELKTGAVDKLAITFVSATGVLYSVDASTSIVHVAWTEQTNEVEGTGSDVTVDLSMPEHPCMFYRLRLGN